MKLELSDFPPELIDALAERVATRVQAPTDDGWLRGAGAIADYLGCPRSRVYTFSSERTRGCPIRHDGSTLIAKRSELDAWYATVGGR